MLKSPFRLAKPAVLTAVGLTLIVGGTVIAQVQPMEPVQWDKRRLDQLDRNVRRLERALTQRNAAGQPVIVEPDPEVVALQGQVSILERRLSDLEQTFQRVNADGERVTFQLDEATRDNALLTRRLRDLENRVERAEKAAQEAAELNGPIVPNSPTGDAAQDLQAAMRLAGEDAVRGGRALETVIVTWPSTPQSREANSRLGDLHVAARDNASAVQAYAAALNGWPRTPWAAETTLKLAEALRATDRASLACNALADFNTRYAQGATAAQKTRAAQLRTRANCS
ncbi:tol-pal system protein [Brevundimonas naejangsanensis]|uniref:Tol-pal system protein n=1 Tax=Brevundimonas naejangsanensis TaxID=588932 RepID=A0A494RIA6_9CAUL|nr:tol-pal system protein [Brevundimonas naejangsanensis]AYG94200.1 tol-pal system protein [Brevundimonas naejangsanensis]